MIINKIEKGLEKDSFNPCINLEIQIQIEDIKEFDSEQGKLNFINKLLEEVKNEIK